MSSKFYILGFIFLFVAIAVYQYQKKVFSIEENTAIALQKVIGNRTSSYTKVAVGYVDVTVNASFINNAVILSFVQTSFTLY